MEALSKAKTAPPVANLLRFVVPVVALVTSLVVMAVIWRAQGLVDQRPDPYWFSAMAESLVRGEGFAKYGSLLHRRTPGYPFMIAALYTVFGVRVIAVQLFQCLLFAGSCWLAQDIASRIFSPRVGVIAGLLCCVHPLLLRYVPDLHLETLLTFLFTLSVWLSCVFAERATLGRGAALGLVWGLATLTKAVVLLYPAVFGLLWWWTRGRSQFAAGGKLKVLAPFGAALAVMALTIAPWTARNYVVTGHIVPVTTGASDAVLRSYVFTRTEFITLRRPPYTDAENEVNAWFKQLCAAEGAVWENDDYQTDQILNKAAKAHMLAAPGAFVKKTVVGLFTFWYQMTSLANSLSTGAMALAAWGFALLGLRRAAREKRPAWLVLAPIIYLNVFLALLLSLGRYSVPVMPCLLVLSGAGVDVVLGWLRPAKSAGALPV